MRRLALLALLASGAAFQAPRTATRALNHVRAGEEPKELEVASEIPEVNSGAEAVELLFKDPKGYKAARDEYDRKMAADIAEEGGVDRGFFIQAAAVCAGSFALGISARQGPPPESK